MGEAQVAEAMSVLRQGSVRRGYSAHRQEFSGPDLRNEADNMPSEDHSRTCLSAHPYVA